MNHILLFIFTISVFSLQSCLPALVSTDIYHPVPAEISTKYGLIGVRLIAASTDSVEVAHVLPRSPAARAGLVSGDRLLAADEYRLRTPQEASRYLQSLEPGSSTLLRIQRDGRVAKISCQISDIQELYYTMSENGKMAGAVQARHREWSLRQHRLEEHTRTLARNHDMVDELQDLEAAFEIEFDRFGADSRLQDVHYALQHPLKSGYITAQLANDAVVALTLPDHLSIAAKRLDATAGAKPGPAEMNDSNDNDSIGPYLATQYERAVQQADLAFAELDSASADTLFGGVAEWLELFIAGRYVEVADTAAYRNQIRMIQLAKKVDPVHLLAAAQIAAEFATPKSLARIIELTAPSTLVTPGSLPTDFSGDFKHAELTEWGWIIVGGTGDNIYSRDAAMIVDLGGDDLYLNNCGSPVTSVDNGERRQVSRVGLIIDMAGDDRYIGNRLGSIGSGVAGVGMVVDLSGDDLYQGAQMCQGSAFCGVGILRDDEGDDQYLAQTTAQGCAFYGAGLLLDARGNDLFSSTLLSQAFGGPRGYGVLLDREGDDYFVADLVAPSSYGTKNVFQGWSQGMGSGLRGASSGGIGLLVDAAGNDEYQAGNFSQGTGYFFGLGMLVDRGGDDLFRGSRYVQGTAAHQAVGVLIDESGNDVYSAEPAAAQGAGWDAAVGILEDRGGDDQYTAGDLAQGAAAMNGFGVLFDWSGNDTYQARSGQGHGGSTTYWGGRKAKNLGVLIDGGGKDAFSDTLHADEHSSVTPGVGLFLDH
jgi:hypothetical protein